MAEGSLRLQFDPDLDHQREAIAAVVDAFRGQEHGHTNFTVAPSTVASEQHELEVVETALGIGNRLRLLPEDLLRNVQEVQTRNGLAPSPAISSKDFTVEMETGTGKTYVYLRTILELNREYGFTKFVIVVPSIAIKEGVYKSLQITRRHFEGLYDNVPYDFFVYDSKELSQVRSFATSDQVQIMVINIDAFKRSFTDPESESSANIIHRPHDGMSGHKPIDFIRDTHPIVIIDEPQSVDTTTKSQEAIASLNPLCTIRYSATHIDKHHMLYKLDAVDAYERKLVKQIEVAELALSDSHNDAYVELLSVNNRAGGIQATILLDVQLVSGAISRTKRTVKKGDDLFEISGGRELYQGYIVEDIAKVDDRWVLSFTSRPEEVWEGEAVGGVDDDTFKRMQIRKTIEEHLDKELRLNPQGIKVLSLFFIDRVANYREYDEEGNPVKGKFALWFEEEFAKAARKARYRTLFGEIDVDAAASDVHNGYFAIDRKTDAKGDPRFKESKTGTAQSDESAYELIMKDKEQLLSLETPLRFIFSHSALREGWDNPNVFQICTLNESASTLKKRQEIGRGLRIAVNQQGERVHGFEVNTLTVMANESYDEFVRALQKELEEDTGIRFGVVEAHLFVDLPYGPDEAMGIDRSKAIVDHLEAEGMIDVAGTVSDALRVAIKQGDVPLPAEFQEHAHLIVPRLRKVAGSLDIKKREDRRPIGLNKAVLLSPEFEELWERIRYKTTYRVAFDSDKLIEECAEQIKREVKVGRAHFLYTRATTEIGRGGLETEVTESLTYDYDASRFGIPDVLGYLQEKTNLTRRSLAQILVRSEKLHMLKNNPQKFIEQVLKIIQKRMQLFIVDGIKYRRIGDQAWFAQELFQDAELYGYLQKNMLESTKSPFEHVVYDLGVERDFAQSMEESGDVKVYAKLPPSFKIDTPLGSYNPDWAVLVDQDGHERLYFVVETKGTLFTDALRATEKAKIQCGEKHVEALNTGARFEVADSFATFRDRWTAD